MAHRLPEKQVVEVPLRVLPRGTALVPDYGALMNPSHPTRRFHGWRHDREVGGDMLDSKGQPTGLKHGGFVKRVAETPEHAVEIPASSPHRTEYVRHLRDGDLWAADLQTAQAAGVAFEPDFGGEHPGLAALLAAKAPKVAPVPVPAAPEPLPPPKAGK